MALEKVVYTYPGPTLGALHLLVADYMGFYRKQGLDVELVSAKTSTAIAALISGDAHYLAAAGSTMRAAEKGAEVKLTSVALVSALHSLVTKADATPESVRGGAFASDGAGGTADFNLRYLIQRGFGLDPASDVTILYLGETPLRYAALESGQIQGTVFSPPWTQRAKRAGFKVVGNIGDYLQMPFEGVGTTTRRIAEAREQVKRMIRAENEALAFIRTEPERTIEIIQKVLNMDEEIARDGYEEAKPYYNRDGRIDPAVIDNFLKAEGLEGTDHAKLYDPTLAQEVYAESAGSRR